MLCLFAYPKSFRKLTLGTPCKQQHQDDILDIWVQSLAARQLSAQHELLDLLLTLDPIPELLTDVEVIEFERDTETGHISSKGLEANRVEIFCGQSRKLMSPHLKLAADQDWELETALFRNAGLAMSRGQVASPPALSKPLVTNLVRAAFTSMKDNMGVRSHLHSFHAVLD